MTTGTVWVDGLTIGTMLRTTAEKFPDHDAVVFTSLDSAGRLVKSPTERTADCFRRTFAQLDADVDRVANSLIALGIDKGDHVAVWGTNWPAWVLLQYATARIGAVQVNINPAYRASELAYVLKQSDAKALFLIYRFRTSNYFQMLADAVAELATSQPGQLNSAAYPRLKHVVSMNESTSAGIRGWSDFLAGGASIDAAALRARERSLSATDPINIQYTSGTTGFPKGAILTHRNLLLNAYYVGDCQRITARDRICVPVPFYHCFGCVMGVLCTAIYGAAMIVPAEHFDPEATLYALETQRATSLYGVPTMFIAQLEHPSFAQRNLKSLRTGIMAGSPCPVEVMKRVADDMGAREITIAYGLTEASPVITQTRTADPLEVRVKTVGKPIPHLEVKLVDPATGATLPDDVQGELCTRGHGVMLGYYNNPEATRAAIDADNWLHTGDLAVRTPDGNYRITGRMKDMICRGGENIYPREIEEFLFTHPAVEAVAIVGVPDKKYVEQVAAWIKLKAGATATADDIRAYCKGRIAHYKIPYYVKFVGEFPQTVTGKIQKFKMREAMIAELGLEQAETA